MRRMGGVLLVLMLTACSGAGDPVDPRTPAERANPDLAAWRGGAVALAKGLAAGLKDSKTVFLSVDTHNAPDYFPDLLVEELVRSGVSVVSGAAPADGNGAAVTVQCRAVPVGTLARPRGVSAVADAGGGLAVFCSAMREGQVIAAIDHLLAVRLDTAPPAGGTIIRVTQ